MDSGSEDELDLKWYGTVNTRFHISLFPSTEEYVANYAEQEPSTVVFEVTQLNYLPDPDTVQLYLLAEENMLELATRTGFPEENFRSMQKWDEDFGVTSKIYLIPEKS